MGCEESTAGWRQAAPRVFISTLPDVLVPWESGISVLGTLLRYRNLESEIGPRPPCLAFQVEQDVECSLLNAWTFSARAILSHTSTWQGVLYRFDRLFTSRITGRRELNQYAIRHASQGSVNTTENDDKSAKKNLCVCRLVCEQFFSRVTHHIELWTSSPVNYGRHASQGVNNRSKRYSTSEG